MRWENTTIKRTTPLRRPDAIFGIRKTIAIAYVSFLDIQKLVRSHGIRGGEVKINALAYFITADAFMTSYLYDLFEASWLLRYDDVEGIVWMVAVVGVDFIAGVIVYNKTIKMKMKFMNVAFVNMCIQSACL